MSSNENNKNNNSNPNKNNNNKHTPKKVKLKEETKNKINTKKISNSENIEDISIKSVDIESEVVRNSELDPEASVYLPKKNETNENIQQQQPLPTFDYQKWIEDEVQFQVDYHFGDVSLSMDNYLLSRMHEDKDYWVSFDIVAHLTKIKNTTSDTEVIRKAIRKSELVIFNEDETKVKRPNFIPPKPKQHKDLRRTVFLYGLSSDITIEQIKILCGTYGVVKKVVLDNPNDTKTIKVDDKTQNKKKVKDTKKLKIVVDKRNSILLDTEPPDREVAEIVMKKKFGPRIVPLNNNNPMSPMNSNNLSGLSIDTGLNNNMSNVALTQSFIHPIQNPNGDINDFSHLRTAFVVFDSQGQATKCVKDRLRSMDGIRAMHQYDFNKAKKKVASSKAKGVSPLFSPLNTSIPSNLNILSPQQSFNFNNINNNGMIQLPPSHHFNNMNNNNSMMRRSYHHTNNRYPQSARNYNQNLNRRHTHHSSHINKHNKHYRNNTYPKFHSQSTRNYNNNNNNNNQFRRPSKGGSRWDFIDKNQNQNQKHTNKMISPHHKPLINSQTKPSQQHHKTFHNKKTPSQYFNGKTARGPENHKKIFYNSKKQGFGWTRNSSNKPQGLIPPNTSPNNFTFNTQDNKSNSNKQYYTYKKKTSQTPNSLTATISASTNTKQPPRTTTSVTQWVNTE